jgi:hypothetical protein
MKRCAALFCTLLLCQLLVSPACSQTDSAAAKKATPKAAKTAPAAKTATVEKAAPAAAAKKETASAPAAKGAGDTLIVIARITEIPGKFASNDLYNYVYVMKYRVLSVVKGSYKEQDILVGQYNPLIPRAQVKDNMKKNVSGNVEKFEVGAKHKLWLIAPIEKVWKDAVDDEYSDSELQKYYAARTDVAQ